jgi:hypothetical protein
MSTKEDRFCRICHGSEDPELGELFSPCKCTGSMKFVHVECLNQWRRSSTNPSSYFKCDTCKYNYLLHRPRLAYMLRSSKFVAGATIFCFSGIIVGRYFFYVFHLHQWFTCINHSKRRLQFSRLSNIWTILHWMYCNYPRSIHCIASSPQDNQFETS